MYSNKSVNHKNFQLINYRNYVKDEMRINNNFNKEYYDEKEGHNNQLNNEDKISNLKNKYQEFKQFLYEKLNKKQYKFVIYQIELNIFTYRELKEKYELKFLKIEVLLKIVNNKIKKYHKSKLLNDYQSKQKNHFLKRVTAINLKYYKYFKKPSINLTLSTKNFISIENYFSKINNEIEMLVEDIDKIWDNNKIIFIEKIIQLYLKLLIVSEYYNKIENKVPNNFCYLSFGEYIINNFYSYMRNSFSLNTSEEIFLIIAKILISNQDFEKAETYCIRTVNFCIKECFLLINTDNDDLKNISFKAKEKVILNLCISLFYIGICKENKGNIGMASKYYNLSEIFIKNLLLNDDEVEENEKEIKNYNLFHKYILSVKQRCQDYFSIIKNLSKQNSIVIIEKIKKKKKLEEIQKINEKYKNQKTITFISLNNKMKKIEDKVKKIKIPQEINVNRHSITKPLNQSLNLSSSEKNFNYKNYILSDLRLLEDYNSKSFKKTLNSMEKIKFIDLDISIKEKLEKIIDRKNSKKQLQLLNINQNHFQSFRKTLIKLRKFSPNIFQQYKNNSFNERNYLNKSINNNNTVTINNYQIKEMNSSTIFVNTKKDKNDKTSLSHNKFKRNKFQIERLKVNNNFENSNSFKQKKIFVNGLRDRETAFLKKLLKIKSEEKLFENESFDLMKVKREAKKKFDIIKECNVTNEEENLKEKIKNLLYLKKKEYNKKTIKNTKIIQNLSENNLLSKFDKKKNVFYLNNKELTNKHNKNIIQNINFNIEDLSKERRGLEEEMREMKLGKINL